MKETQMKNFDGLSLHPTLTNSLKVMKYDIPTPIQAQCIPLALDGRDVMGSAQTGTGKTAAFAIPVIDSLLNNSRGSALILTPTRELGKQVMDIMHQLLGRDSGINTAFLIGGDSMSKQINQIRKNPRLIVGTPGRINDHLERGSLKLQDTGFLVLDEMDRMLDMGFSVQLDRIFKYLPNKRQTLMFSATLPGNIVKMAQQHLNNPERIAVGSTIEPAKNIKQEIIKVPQEQKYDALLNLLETRSGTIVMFVKTKFGTERMAKRLKNDGFDADALHGDLKQSRRDRVVQNFRDMKFQILVATDVAARGLDIPHIEHVVNFDLPQVPEDFIHRIGRTARAGAKGEAISFVSPQEARKWFAIEQLMDPTMKGASMPDKGSARPRKGKRNDGPTRGKKPFGKKPFGRSDDQRDSARSDKPFAKKPFGKKPSKKSFDDRDDQRNDKPYGKKPFVKFYDSRDEERGEKPFVKKHFGKKPFRKDGENDSQSQDGRGFANKKTGFKPKHKTEGKSSEGRKDYKRDDRKDDRQEGGKSYGKKPFAKKTSGKKPFGTSNKPTNSASKKKGGKNGTSNFKGKPSTGGFKGKSSAGGKKSYSASGGGNKPRTRAA